MISLNDVVSIEEWYVNFGPKDVVLARCYSRNVD